MAVYFISGIDTDAGKSIVTGVIARTLLQKGVHVITQKFIQTGCVGISEDILKHREIMGIPPQEVDRDGTTCPYVMTYPSSPHLAAEIDRVEIDVERIHRSTEKLAAAYDVVLLEGAGGLYVPVSRQYLTIDYIQEYKHPLILVSSSKLGSINHTLMSLELCRLRGIEVAYVVYNDFPNDSEWIKNDSITIIRQYLDEHFPDCRLLELCGSAAGYYARTLMVRHKFTEALTVLEDIIGKKYGTYRLMTNYGDNFREGSAYENNDESLFEVQFLDYGSQGTDDEWTPVNTSPNATQGHAIESNLAPGTFSGWADLAASPWLYELFKGERTKDGGLDPRLYWTLGTYENEWEGFEYGNVAYSKALTAADKNIITHNGNGGIPIAKNTNYRTGLYNTVTTGLRCGINLRLMRYSDVLLRAAECENEVNGPTEKAIGWINEVRSRAGLPDLKLEDFDTADKLFEQIANVERPKEFGCEFGRGFDLIRWGFFYDNGRLQQLKEHGTFRRSNDPDKLLEPVSYSSIGSDSELKCSFDSYLPGHEFLPIYQDLLNTNPNLKGNSANYGTDNSAYFKEKGWTVRPVVNLGE